MKQVVILSLALCLAAFADDEEQRTPSSVPSASRPSAEEVKKVMDYFNTGKELLLTEKKFCKEIGKDGATKNDCVQELASNEIVKGEKSFLWMNFMVPKDFKEGNVLIQYNQNGVTRSASQRPISAKDGALRYRLHSQFPTLAPGEYEVSLMLEANGQVTPLDKANLVVKAKN